jgi:hypothetical protein
MLRRLLNIASIVCLVLCVALLRMWARSYYYQDTLSAGITRTHTFAVESIPGRVLFGHLSALVPRERQEWSFNSKLADQIWIKSPITGSLPLLARGTPFGFSIFILAPGPLGETGHSVMLPFWFLVLASGSLAMLFQLRWPPQFTLRSLFIATTFLAILLGMIAWLDHSWIGK